MNYQVEQIELWRIKDDEYVTRGELDRMKLDELVKSIQSHGVLQPILVRMDKDRYVVVAGHRRCAACKILQTGTIPAAIISDDSNKDWELALHENLIRADLSPIEEAAVICDCVQSGTYDIESMARAVGRSVTWVAERIAMIDWPPEITAAVHVGKISVSAAKNLVGITDKVQRELLVQYAIDNGSTARTTAAWLQAFRAGIKTNEPESIEPKPGYASQQPITPHTPCVICGGMMRMVDLTYLPTCADCHEHLLHAVRKEMQRQSGQESKL
ncbi:MAG: hypothetical protein AMJ79_12815 [Phycisphaerae bacterium SM23_30]|nr:MAG: hypothetical protein AMJ79_12815 [Phycisphaerae bacterium SM23_30]